MYKLAILFALTCSAPALYPMVRAGVDVDGGYYDDNDGNVQVVIWGGPGYYYGVWFGNEWDYNNWRYHNGYYYGGYRHYYGGRGWRGGGGHWHGGGHGGGGHGGGHH